MEISKEIIMENINNPHILEELYQSNKKIYTEIIANIHNEDSELIIKYWYTRLFYKPSINNNKKVNIKKYVFTAFLIIITWLPIRLMFIDSFSDKNYIIKLIPIIFTLMLSVYFLYGSFKLKNIIYCVVPCIVLYIYFILLPDNFNSQSLNNANYFMFIILWFLILLSQFNYNFKKLEYNIFLEKNGEVVIWSTMFIIGGVIVVSLSFALFEAINISPYRFYLENIVTLGLVAAPFVSLLVIENNKIKLSVIIAKIFLPIILISLIIFGFISMFSETKPYGNRDIFIIYNIMNVLVLCVLVFTSINGINSKFIKICYYILPVITLILNIITFSAVIYRISEYGITPNKITLFGTNVVMIGHLIYIIYLNYKQKINRNVLYLPIYLIWSLVVVFVFPFLFKFS